METSIPAYAQMLDRPTVMRALSDPSRWEILAQLVKGKPLSVSELAAATRRSLQAVSKQLHVLRDARILSVNRAAVGNDARRQLHSIPAVFLTAPGVIDFGFCLLRFG